METVESAPPDVVVLSPHLDDAVLSMGGSAKMTASGLAVEVWTCFTAAPSGPVPEDRRVFADYETRRKEDLQALSLLRSRHRWLGLTERIWREPPLPRVADVLRTPEDATEWTLREVLTEAYAHPRTRIFAPLGVGNHYDHVQVALAAMRFMAARRAFERFTFYEDFYALGGRCRRRHFVTGRSRQLGIFGPAWASPALAASLVVTGHSMCGPGLERVLPSFETFTRTSSVESLDGFDLNLQQPAPKAEMEHGANSRDRPMLREPAYLGRNRTRTLRAVSGHTGPS